MSAPPPIPPRPSGFQQAPQPQQMLPYFPPPPQAQQQSSSSYGPQSQQYNAPPPPPPRPSAQYSSQYSYNYSQPQTEREPTSSYRQPAHQYTPPQQQSQYAPAGFGPPPSEPAPAPSNWTEHLFYSNGRPTPAFQAIANAFFQKLDPRETGFITPEAFSSFQEACEYTTDQNVWKRNLTANVMFAAEDMADYELKASLVGFYFDHKVVVRNPSARQLPGGGMPLTSLAGFTDWIGIDFAADPDEHLPGLNRALKRYGLFPEKGPLPRYVFPATRPRELQRRIDEATMRCSHNAQTALNAQAAQHAMAQRGQQAALDLIGNVRYVYY